jgi:hypothetical protein
MLLAAWNKPACGRNELAHVYRDGPYWIPLFSSYINIAIYWLDLTAHYLLMFIWQLHGMVSDNSFPYCAALFFLSRTMAFPHYILVNNGSVTTALPLHVNVPEMSWRHHIHASFKYEILGCGRLKSNVKISRQLEQGKRSRGRPVSIFRTN